MSESDIKFHRVEDYALGIHASPHEQAVVCSFKTQRFGYLQIGFDENGVYELPNEPDLNMFRQKDKKFIESAAAIAWRMIFDAPAAKERFE